MPSVAIMSFLAALADTKQVGMPVGVVAPPSASLLGGACSDTCEAKAWARAWQSALGTVILCARACTRAAEMFSAAHVERLFSPSVGVRLRCCFFSVDDPKSNCCGAMISMRNVECFRLWAHLKTAHGVDEAAYMQRAHALGWL